MGVIQTCSKEYCETINQIYMTVLFCRNFGICQWATLIPIPFLLAVSNHKQLMVSPYKQGYHPGVRTCTSNLKRLLAFFGPKGTKVIAM